MPKNIYFFEAADLCVKLSAGATFSGNTLDNKFTYFKKEIPITTVASEIEHFIRPPMPRDIQKDKTTLQIIFEDETWKLSASANLYLYEYDASNWSKIPYKAMAVFNKKHSKGKIYFTGLNKEQYAELYLSSLCGLASDQILISKLLLQRDGFLFHANGVCLKGKTILFTGHTGAGKSTISRIMKSNGAKIFCDDRVIIQKKEDAFFSSGSWIHPGVTTDSTFTGQTDAVFFIEQSDINSVELISNISEKYTHAVKGLVKDFASSDLIDKNLSLLHDFIKRIPFYSLKFNLSGEIYKIIADVIQ